MTPTKETTTVEDLIARLEKATGPNFELECAIYFAVEATEHVKAFHARQPKGQTFAQTLCALGIKPPIYMGSLDAAMTLRKEGNYDFSLSFTTRGGPEFTEWQARVALDTIEDDPDETGPQALGEGHTAPLACCIAFLKSRSKPKDVKDE